MRAFADELTQTETRQLKTLFAEMISTTNIPHNWVEHAAVQKFFKALRLAFKLPTRHELSTPLLLGVYVAIATKVKLELKKHQWLTSTSDGWSREKGSQHITNSRQQYLEHPTSSTSTLLPQGRSQVSLQSCAGRSCGCHYACIQTAAVILALC